MRPLHDLHDPLEKSRRWPAVHQPVIERQAQHNHLPDGKLILPHRRARGNPPNALGIYLYDARLGLREPLHRDPEIGSQFPIPVRPRPRPPISSARAAESAASDRAPEGRFMYRYVGN